jgi:hypothetical protein
MWVGPTRFKGALKIFFASQSLSLSLFALKKLRGSRGKISGATGIDNIAPRSRRYFVSM